MRAFSRCLRYSRVPSFGTGEPWGLPLLRDLRKRTKSTTVEETILGYCVNKVRYVRVMHNSTVLIIFRSIIFRLFWQNCDLALTTGICRTYDYENYLWIINLAKVNPAVWRFRAGQTSLIKPFWPMQFCSPMIYYLEYAYYNKYKTSKALVLKPPQCLVVTLSDRANMT